MTSDRVLSHLDRLGAALREALAVLRDAEVREAVEGLAATHAMNRPQGEAAQRVCHAVALAEQELGAIRAALARPEDTKA